MPTEKFVALVVESCEVLFAVLHGERSCDVEGRGNIVARQNSMKSSVHLVFSFVNNLLCWWTMAKMASKETCRVCPIYAGGDE